MSSLGTAYIQALVSHPVRTKGATSGALNALAELLGGLLSGQKDPQTNSYFGPRVIKMAVYGALVSGPLSHYLIAFVQRAFKRARRGWKTNVLQVIAINLLVNPVMAVSFITWMSLMDGTRSVRQLRQRLQASLLTVLKSQWLTSPLLIAFAQQYVPKIAWTPMFSFFAFILSTYHNVIIRRRIADSLAKK